MVKEYLDKLNFLIEDENEAIDGYVKAIELFTSMEEDKKEIIIKQLEHIKEEEEEHIRELEELKKVLEDASYTPDLDTLTEATRPKRVYHYEGPIMRFGRIVAWEWEDNTQAVSEAQALNNLRFKAGKYLGLDVGSHNVKIELDPECLEVVDDDDGYFDDYIDLDTDHRKCDKCGTPLNDGGTCPVCDDSEEDY